MARFYYQNTISSFLIDDNQKILGELVSKHEYNLEEQQKNSWATQITLLKKWLKSIDGTIIFEYNIPRMGKRIDCVLLSNSIIFAIEFKIGAEQYDSNAIDQVIDHALDLKNFHEQSHKKYIVPILICTSAKYKSTTLIFDDDQVAKVILCSGEQLPDIIKTTTKQFSTIKIDSNSWLNSIYKPTPTIIEAAQALYNGHKVKEISRSDSGAINLSRTAAAIHSIISYSKENKRKSICFLTGVPGAGKTLAGLNLANSWHNSKNSEHAIFLSGNGPLVKVLREALARNEVIVSRERGIKTKKSITMRKAKAFIQNIHHFRDDALDSTLAPNEKVVIFDEAQRAWTLKQTASFMKIKKGKLNFNQSEPELLISVMDRHKDWATIICLIGGGQEINTGEAGLIEWFDSLNKSFKNWDIYISSQLSDSEYTQGKVLFSNELLKRIINNDDLHLSVSVRSYRSEKVAALVKSILDINKSVAKQLLKDIKHFYPIVITRDLTIAKGWLRSHARGSERYGIVASSGAIRLKSFGFNVTASIDPVNWFLNNKQDIRSAYYLEDVATEFDIQGLELDWVCVAWDANLRFSDNIWELKSFHGSSWQEVNNENNKRYLINSYRVLLTRARQGMIIFIPKGDENDHTRLPDYYDRTFNYFKSIGFEEI